MRSEARSQRPLQPISKDGARTTSAKGKSSRVSIERGKREMFWIGVRGEDVPRLIALHWLKARCGCLFEEEEEEAALDNFELTFE